MDKQAAKGDAERVLALFVKVVNIHAPEAQLTDYARDVLAEYLQDALIEAWDGGYVEGYDKGCEDGEAVERD